MVKVPDVHVGLGIVPVPTSQTGNLKIHGALGRVHRKVLSKGTVISPRLSTALILPKKSQKEDLKGSTYSKNLMAPSTSLINI